MKAFTFLLIACATFVGQANAASPDAWVALEKAVIESCMKASQLKEVRAVGKTGFDDNLGYEALMLRGRYPQPHMKNQPGAELCLYNRQTKKATVSEWTELPATLKK
ncbi:hypothetical protein AUC61_11520 [Pseudomonas sp. S25]|uniref:Uncharacterized protein n=1 Tax=Pseudomonas maioricensis TaxID=1766623 RepID=A0ABS9ZHT1_9PSED|nr:hypothetical protein [Pseudomonas sp. S25]MCI8210165.1 hypothetical protein [Pseudomonas sp. S25]